MAVSQSMGLMPGILSWSKSTQAGPKHPSANEATGNAAESSESCYHLDRWDLCPYHIHMNAGGTMKMQSIYDCVGNDPTVKLELGAQVVHPLALPKPRVPLTLETSW